jgi:hypothetical protein
MENSNNEREGKMRNLLMIYPDKQNTLSRQTDWLTRIINKFNVKLHDLGSEIEARLDAEKIKFPGTVVRQGSHTY